MAHLELQTLDFKTREITLKVHCDHCPAEQNIRLPHQFGLDDLTEALLDHSWGYGICPPCGRRRSLIDGYGPPVG